MSINTNTIVSILIALVLFYIFIKVAESIGKLIALIVFVGVLLFGVQSLGICNIPVMNKIYPAVTKVIPYKQIWSNFDKAVKIKNDLK
jgi:predicted RND superfamily exporter protein